ncbi:HprK-related kinase A [Chromatiaceae bacterium AAb-1]|nr:HprK-related kinase A [Chromatiaceae bacterium AAb-1]
MTDFAVHLHPFSVAVNNHCRALAQAVHALYPSAIVRKIDTAHLYDFTLDVKRRFTGRSWPFHVSAGQQHFRMSEQKQLVPIFEWGINWCVASYQHQYLAIHAAVLERDGKTLVLPAPPGAGKSTLCAVLMLEGWRLLSDEMCLIAPDSGNIIPCVRPVSLKNRSLQLIKQWYPAVTLQQITAGTPKGTVGFLAPSPQSWQQYQQVAAPCIVIFPQYDAARIILHLSEVSKADAFMHLAQNSFNYAVLAEQGFNCLADFISRITAYRMEYADIEQVLAALDAL